MLSVSKHTHWISHMKSLLLAALHLCLEVPQEVIGHRQKVYIEIIYVLKVMIRLSLPNTMILLIVLLTLVLNMSLVSAQDNFTAAVGQDKIFTEFNSHDAWFDRSPGFTLPLPEPREAISSGNSAHVSLSASQGHEGTAVAKLGVNITWDMNGHTWEEIKDWPINIAFNYHYNIESHWVEGNGSANAWIQTEDVNDLTIYQQIGHLVGQAGSSEGESIEYLNTTLGVIGDRICLGAFCEAGSYASSIHTSSATLQLYSITIEFENPPTTPTPPIGPPCRSIGQECVFMAMAEDPDGDDVKFIFDWGDGSTSETEFVKSGMWKSAPHQWSTHGLYEVKVKAKDSKGAVSDWSEASTIYISAPPAKLLTPSGPDSGFKRTTYTFSTSAIDPDEGDQINFTFDWGDGSISETGFVNSGSTISESHRWSSSGTYQIQVMATDTCNVSSEWSDPMSITIVNRPPFKPILSGPINGYIKAAYLYSTQTIDPDEDDLRYNFYWGDGLVFPTGLVPSGTTVNCYHVWDNIGKYTVRTEAIDEEGASSELSDPLDVTISNTPPFNLPPNPPNRPSGPTYGYVGRTYNYLAYTIDPNGDLVKYSFDWGDGSTSETGFVDSGSSASGSHGWGSNGIYIVRAMATDSKGASSDWSDPLNVIINAPPSTPAVPVGPVSGSPGISYSYTTSATDPDGDKIAYTFDWWDGTNSTTSLLDSGAIANTTHTWNIAGIYAVKAKATDSKGLDSEWSNAINVSIANNSCISGTKFNDTNSNATRDPGEAGLPGWTIRLTRPDGTSINATTDASGGYKFENLTSGTYRVSEIRQSNWTQTYPAWMGDHIINITDDSVTGVDFGNNYLPVPEIPFPPAGPASGIPGAEYSYSTSSTDPSGYQISYTFDWGDGTNSTTGLFDSGAVASAAHIWNSSGIYQVRAMATNSKGASSEWSDPLEVDIAAGIAADKIGVFRNGPWYIDYNGNKEWDPDSGDVSFWFGTGGDLPFAGDWSGDDVDEIGVFRNGPWYIDHNGNRQWDPDSGDLSFWFGTSGDFPIAGDWNGDGRDEIGVFRNGPWYLDYNGNRVWDPDSGDVSFWFGTSGDLPIAGDWNGDGKDEIGVFRNGPWYLDYNGNREWDPASGDVSFWFGTSGDAPLAGDWNSDGIDEIGVFRNGPWYLDYNGNREWDPASGDVSFWFGTSGDRPVEGRWGSLSSSLGLDNDKTPLGLSPHSALLTRSS